VNWCEPAKISTDAVGELSHQTLMVSKLQYEVSYFIFVAHEALEQNMNLKVSYFAHCERI